MRQIAIIVLLACSVSVLGQSIPEAATADFDTRFNHHTEAVNIVWDATTDGYTVTYEFNDRQVYVFYNDKGTFRESRVSMQYDELEQGVQQYISDHYADATFSAAFRLNTQTAPERSVVELNNNGQLITLYFRPDGTFHYGEK